MASMRLSPNAVALSEYHCLRVCYNVVVRERDLLRSEVHNLRSLHGALQVQNGELLAEKQHLLIELDKLMNAYTELQYQQFIRDEAEPERQKTMLEMHNAKNKAVAEVERLKQALDTYDGNMAMLQADKRATEAALEATKAEAAAVRMHDSLPQRSLRALMHQRTQAWAAERTALRKECDELREFKERMQHEVCCEVCYDAVASQPLPNCCHRLCKGCSEKVDSCPFCRATLQDENQPTPRFHSQPRSTPSTYGRTPFSSVNLSPGSAQFMPRALSFSSPGGPQGSFLTSSSSPMN